MAVVDPISGRPGAKDRIRTILVVDDNSLLRFTIAAFLEDSGFIALEARTADRAIEMILDADNAVDLVFSDVMMPGSIDGLGLARWIKANRPDIPLILTSTECKREAAVKELFESERFLVKPYDVKLAVAKIGRTIGASAA